MNKHLQTVLYDILKSESSMIEFIMTRADLFTLKSAIFKTEVLNDNLMINAKVIIKTVSIATSSFKHTSIFNAHENQEVNDAMHLLSTQHAMMTDNSRLLCVSIQTDTKCRCNQANLIQIHHQSRVVFE